MFVRQKDLRAEPVKRIVALGESTTWGYSVSDKNKCWVNLVAGMIEEFQGRPVELINQGIGSNVLTPQCPAYEHSARPSALERVESEVIELVPDLLLLSYGLNDSRGGITPEVFRQQYQQLIDRIRSRIQPLIVILNAYYMHEICYIGTPEIDGKIWGNSNYQVTEEFNRVIEQLARSNGLVLADIYASEMGVDWIIDEDHCHPNDLGHRIVANKVFEAIARNCSFVAITMPRTTLIGEFAKKYGNGPDCPFASGVTSDIMAPKTD